MTMRYRGRGRPTRWSGACIARQGEEAEEGAGLPAEMLDQPGIGRIFGCLAQELVPTAHQRFDPDQVGVGVQAASSIVAECERVFEQALDPAGQRCVLWGWCGLDRLVTTPQQVRQ